MKTERRDRGEIQSEETEGEMAEKIRGKEKEGTKGKVAEK